MQNDKKTGDCSLTKEDFVRFARSRKFPEDDAKLFERFGLVAIDAFCWHRDEGELFDTVEAFFDVTKRVLPLGEKTLRRRDIPEDVLEAWRAGLGVQKGQRVDYDLEKRWMERLHPLFFTPFLLSRFGDVGNGAREA